MRRVIWMRIRILLWILIFNRPLSFSNKEDKYHEDQDLDEQDPEQDVEEDLDEEGNLDEE
jgi:hypothetical protein